MKDFFSDFYQYLKTHKKLWLFPIIVVLLSVGTILLMAQNPVAAPFIYTVF